MLLERFGLWDARHDRADSYSRGMMQRLALCRTLAARSRPPRARRALQRPRRGRSGAPRSRAGGASAELRVPRLDARPRAHRPLRHVEARAGVMYLADVGALARKDLLLELRARDTLPAMLLFVLSTLVVFHFALPGNSSELAATGLLWVAIVFTALLGLVARVRRRAGAGSHRRSRPRTERPQCDLARQGALASSRSSGWPSSWRSPLSRSSLPRSTAP